MKYYYFIFTIITSIVVLIISCAQPVSPTGGDKDETPPVITRTYPIINSVKTTPNIIRFFFDENIQISTPENNIIISPVPLFKPKYVKNNTSLEIHFKPNSFIASTTYSINLGESIADLNEGNKLNTKPFLFSTGNVLDTGIIYGILEQALGETPSKIKIVCLDSGTENPEYIGQVFESFYSISGLNSKPKTIIAYNDENNNGLADSLEVIGYITDVNSTKNDTIPIKLYSTKKPVINKYSSDNYDYLTGLPINYIEETKLKNHNVFSIADTLFANPAQITALLNNTLSNGFIISNTKNPKKSYTSYVVDQISTPPSHYVSITFNSLILSIDSLKFLKIYQGDTTKLNHATFNINKNILSFNIPFEALPDQVFIPKGSVLLSDSTLRPELKILLKQVPSSTLTFNNKTNKLLTGTVYSSNVIKSLNIAPKSTTTVNVPQGTYEALLFEDLNNDYIINPPVPKTKTTGEFWIKSQNIIANPKLENVIILK